MSLVVNLRGTDGFVVAADSRGTIGDPRGLTAMNDDQQKIFQGSKWCAIGASGSSELAAQVIETLRPKLKEKGAEFVEDITDIAQRHAKQCFQEWFEKFALNERPVVIMSLAGFSASKEPKLYLVASTLDFAPQLCPTGRMLHGIPQYATYLMHRFYDPSAKVASLAKLAAYMITETATQDPKVGGPVRMAIIHEQHGYRDLSGDEVSRIVEDNKRKIEKMRAGFFEE